MATSTLSKTATQVYTGGQEWRGTIRNQVIIDERPEIVEQRARIDVWEGDIMIAKNHQGILVTVAERKSRDILAGQLPAKHAEGVTEKINNLLRLHKHKCHTVIFDNGKEFAGHETIASELEAAIYFAHPYHSWGDD